MPTPEQEKRAAKQRQRSKKADQKGPKSEAQLNRNEAQATGSEPQTAARMEQDPVSPDPVSLSVEQADIAEVAPVAPPAIAEIIDVALSGEVLPPAGPAARVPEAVGPHTIALAYVDYSRRSWQASRFLMERLIAVRSFDEAIGIQGEFAKQAYVNLIAHSREIFELYGELAKQMLRPFETLATGWTPTVR